jgi:hypothetical protein
LPCATMTTCHHEQAALVVAPRLGAPHPDIIVWAGANDRWHTSAAIKGLIGSPPSEMRPRDGKAHGPISMLFQSASAHATQTYGQHSPHWHHPDVGKHSILKCQDDAGKSGSHDSLRDSRLSIRARITMRLVHDDRLVHI